MKKPILISLFLLGAAALLVTGFIDQRQNGLYFLNGDPGQARIVIANDGQAYNWIEINVGGTNIFAVASNGVVVTPSISSATASIPSNTAAFNLPSNPTNNFVASTIYTNGNYRGLLVGSAVLNTSAAATMAGLIVKYTNGGVGYALPITSSNGPVIPFCVPLNPSATFQIVTNGAGSANVYVTNVIVAGG